MPDSTPVQNDAVITIYMIDSFLERHKADISERDYTNLAIASKILRRLAPPGWLSRYQALHPAVGVEPHKKRD